MNFFLNCAQYLPVLPYMHPFTCYPHIVVMRMMSDCRWNGSLNEIACFAYLPQTFIVYSLLAQLEQHIFNIYFSICVGRDMDLFIRAILIHGEKCPPQYNDWSFVSTSHLYTHVLSPVIISFRKFGSVFARGNKSSYILVLSSFGLLSDVAQTFRHPVCIFFL